MKVIFLDIDGVLNCGRWIKELQGGFDNPINQMCPAAVARLNRITDATRAKIVVSSTWRMAFMNRCAEPLVSLQGCLRQYGITGDIIGMTPRKENAVRNVRGKEIQAWLDEHYSEVDKYIIIDDDSDMGKLHTHHVKTLFEDGLLDEHVDVIIERLGKFKYTAESVRTSIAPSYDEYFAKLAVGQSPRWKCDQRTKDNFCLSQWMIDECNRIGCSAEDAHDLLRTFNRRARAEEDQYQVAANAMNSYLDNDIQRYEGLRRH